MKYFKILSVLFLAVILIGSLFLINGYAEKEPETIKIGVILPLTGTLSEVGENAKNGILLALEEANERYKSKGEKFEILLEDGKANPKDAVNAFNKLVNIDRVKFVIGEIASGATLAMAPIAEGNKILLISPGASSPKLSNAGEYIFRTWHTTSYEGDFFARYLREMHNVKTVGILFVNNEYGVGIVNQFSETFKSKGATILFKECFDQNQTNFRSVLSKVKKLAKQVDGVYLVSYYKQAGLLIKQARELKINADFFCSDAIQDPKLIEIAGKAVEGIIYPHAKTPDLTNPIVKKFQTKYKDNFGKEYGPTSDTAYDAFRLLITAINEKGYNSSLVKDYLLNVVGFDGASGKIAFDENGDVLKEMEIKTVTNGNFVIYTRKK